jgi:hypothetical protein
MREGTRRQSTSSYFHLLGKEFLGLFSLIVSSRLPPVQKICFRMGTPAKVRARVSHDAAANPEIEGRADQAATILPAMA